MIVAQQGKIAFHTTYRPTARLENPFADDLQNNKKIKWLLHPTIQLSLINLRPLKIKMKKIFKWLMIIVFSILLVMSVVVAIFLQQPKFGKAPSGERLERIKKSPNYKDGSFQNLSETPMMTEGANYFSVSREFFFGEKKRHKPVDSIPSIKTNLLTLDSAQDVLVWFGHSSYFIQLGGKKILVDPVLSGAASPIASTTRSFPGSDVFSTDDLPTIDYLFISHDHWDHLDYETILKLKSKVKKVICSLGVGEHLEHWGYDKNIIIEEDWHTTIMLDSGFTAHTAPARHFSGRGFVRNKSIWSSFVLESPTHKIFIGGDSGYDTHFADIGKNFGPFDLVNLENGQYNKNWKYIHMLPDEVLKAAGDLKAKRLFPVHSSKFALALHAWDEPLRTITELNNGSNQQVITPMIGEVVFLSDSTQKFSRWWDGVD
jgi:L-ascorbate metabolism protein UlaG (beta-lactamase superfamily)